MLYEHIIRLFAALYGRKASIKAFLNRIDPETPNTVNPRL